MHKLDIPHVHQPPASPEALAIAVRNVAQDMRPVQRDTFLTAIYTWQHALTSLTDDNGFVVFREAVLCLCGLRPVPSRNPTQCDACAMVYDHGDSANDVHTGQNSADDNERPLFCQRTPVPGFTLCEKHLNAMVPRWNEIPTEGPILLPYSPNERLRQTKTASGRQPKRLRIQRTRGSHSPGRTTSSL